MEQQRFHGKSQPFRRRNTSNLNPGANDFIPGQYDGMAGPSHSRSAHHRHAHDGSSVRNPPGSMFTQDSQYWQEEGSRRNQNYDDNNRNTGRRNLQDNHHRPNFGSRPNSFGNLDQSRIGYSYQNSPSNGRFQDNGPRQFQHEHIHEESSFDYNRREPRDFHYSNNPSQHNQENHSDIRNSGHSSGRRYEQGPSNFQNGRNSQRTNDVRYDENYQDTSRHESNDQGYRASSSNNHSLDNSNANMTERQNSNRSEYYYKKSPRNDFGKFNSSKDRSQNNNKSNVHKKDSIDWNSKNNYQDRSETRHRRDVDVRGARSSVVKMSLRESDSNFNLDEKVTCQRDKLIQILFKGTQECLVCCERIAQAQSVWSCDKCYNILHLKCTIQWANSSHTEQGWRCPACQNVSTVVPNVYQCFCKKQVLDFGWNRTDTPHSCGEVCNKDLSRGNSPCGHRCTLLCHPGPCPVCEIVVTRYCGCGQTNCQMQCGSSKTLTCNAVCDKLLNCLKHQCEDICHEGQCKPCNKLVDQTCFCGTDTNSVVCNEDVELNYSCGGICKKKLECGNHNCSNMCHPGPCDVCYLMPQFITTCCCGKTLLSTNQMRNNCTDPIPTCTQLCGKTLHCGELEEKHKCRAECHESECPPCKLNSVVLCNCRQRKRQMKCSELKPDGIVKCNIKCSIMRSCGKHKCNQMCCTTQDHLCPLICNKKLRCGTHKCEHLCHNGQCPACMNVSFEELTCRCGGEVIFPPIPCGTKRPLCGRECSRIHPCSHPPQHSCHDEPECPPCVVFTEKWCYGHHQLRKNIFCNVTAFSCGQACSKVLKCQRHFCNQPCHEGDCLKANEKCKQVCSKPRPTCGHPCNEKCHPGACPGSACTMKINVTCSCGERSDTQACIEDKSLLEQFNRSSKGEYKILECNELCAQMDRNRRLALGLQIRNPDLNLKLKPLYPDLLKQWGKKDPEFCNYVHSKLADLVKLSKESKQKSRSFSFEVMNRDKRQFIHGYSEFFGISAVDCDPEPKRNVIVTAFKDKAWLPGYSLMETLQREKGQLKVPMLPNRDNIKSSKSEMVQLGGKKS